MSPYNPPRILLLNSIFFFYTKKLSPIVPTENYSHPSTQTFDNNHDTAQNVEMNAYNLFPSSNIQSMLDGWKISINITKLHIRID